MARDQVSDHVYCNSCSVVMYVMNHSTHTLNNDTLDLATLSIVERLKVRTVLLLYGKGTQRTVPCRELGCLVYTSVHLLCQKFHSYG